MVCIRAKNLIHLRQDSVGVRRDTGRRGKQLEHGTPESRPERPHARRSGVHSRQRGHDRAGSEGIGLSHYLAGSPHGANDLVRHFRTLDPAERRRQPPSNHRAASVQQRNQNRRGLADSREDDPRLHGVGTKKRRRYANQDVFWCKQSEPVPDLNVPGFRFSPVADIEEGRAERKFEPVVPTLRCVDYHFCRDRGVSPVQQRGLLGGQPPALPEAPFTVTGAELPEDRIPRRRIAGRRGRACRDQPAVRHPAEEAVCDQPFPVYPRQFRRAEDPPAVSLEPFQNRQ